MDKVEAGLLYGRPTVAKAKYHLLRDGRPLCNPFSHAWRTIEATQVKPRDRCRRIGCVKGWARLDKARSAGRLTYFRP